MEDTHTHILLTCCSLLHFSHVFLPHVYSAFQHVVSLLTQVHQGFTSGLRHLRVLACQTS